MIKFLKKDLSYEEKIFFLIPTNCMKANSLWLLEETQYNTKKDFYYKDLDSLVLKGKISFSKLLII